MKIERDCIKYFVNPIPEWRHGATVSLICARLSGELGCPPRSARLYDGINISDRAVKEHRLVSVVATIRLFVLRARR